MVFLTELDYKEICNKGKDYISADKTSLSLKQLQEENTVITCGDFKFVLDRYDLGSECQTDIENIEKLPFTIAFVGGSY